MSQEIIAYCGLDCMACPAYQATIKDDRQMREETAANWSKEFNTVLTADDINCVGCLAEQGVLFEHCQVCKIRSCSRGKDLENCAHCTEYHCQELAGFFAMAPEAQERLDKIRGSHDGS